MPKVFISHSWDDNDISRKIVQYLKRDGIDTWIDYARISGGESLPVRISQALEWCDTMVLIWSKSASTAKWVNKEWSSALSLDKMIIPCLLDDAKLPAILCDLLYINFKNIDTGYNDLCRALKLQTPEEKKTIEAERQKIEQEWLEAERKEKEKQRKLLAEQEEQKKEQERLRSFLQNFTVFRSKPTSLTDEEVKAMLKKNDFFDAYYHKNGKGFNNQFESKIMNGGAVVFDYASGLMWQQSGSSTDMTQTEAQKYIQELNLNKFAGFDDWRLPTLEEAMSLMEPKNMNGDLYIDPKFDATQRWIWTEDRVQGAAWAWVVVFFSGRCNYYYRFYGSSFVRVVRFGQSSSE